MRSFRPVPGIPAQEAHMPHITAHLGRMRMEGLSPGTIYARRRALARLAAVLPVPLLAATPGMLLDWRASLAITAGATANYTRHVTSFYRWAHSQGLVPADPSAGLPIPKTGRGSPRPISEDDLAAAIASAPDRIRLWLVLAACCGLRACEVAYLQAGNIMLRASQPAIFIAEDATKGLNAHVVPVCSFAAAEITAARLPATGYVFRRRDGRAGPNTPQLVSHLANDHLHGCGIASSLHKLRTRFATEFYEASGYNVLALQQVLGHRSIQSTIVYTLVRQPAAARAVEAMPVPRRLRAAG